MEMWWLITQPALGESAKAQTDGKSKRWQERLWTVSQGTGYCRSMNVMSTVMSEHGCISANEWGQIHIRVQKRLMEKVKAHKCPHCVHSKETPWFLFSCFICPLVQGKGIVHSFKEQCRKSAKRRDPKSPRTHNPGNPEWAPTLSGSC